MSEGRDFESEREQREWDAQEAALRAERAGSVAAGDAEFTQYRLIARALRTPQLDVIPHDFARETAARALREQRIANEAVEVWLGRGLIALLLLAGAGALRVYGGEALLGFSFSVPDAATLGIQSVVGWSFAVAACVGISSVFAFAGRR
ncbi:MAG TPA: hypothetical protein VN818_08275 [Gammaproteobacteria bacterium]|nr:hypothetical protein [Gammaproteobacteria bacterium]